MPCAFGLVYGNIHKTHRSFVIEHFNEAFHAWALESLTLPCPLTSRPGWLCSAPAGRPRCSGFCLRKHYVRCLFLTPEIGSLERSGAKQQTQQTVRQTARQTNKHTRRHTRPAGAGDPRGRTPREPAVSPALRGSLPAVLIEHPLDPASAGRGQRMLPQLRSACSASCRSPSVSCSCRENSRLAVALRHYASTLRPPKA